jgi:hypothetical protein
MLASALGASAAGPDNGKLAMQSRVELSVHTAAPQGPMLLRLQGQAFGGQVVELAQSGLVFFEQQLSEGPLLIDKLTPLNPTLPVSTRLRTPSQPEEQGELRLQPQEKLALLTKRPERLTPEPAPVAAPPPPPAKAAAGEDEDFEFDTEFLRGKAFRNMDAASVNKLGRVRAGSIDVDILSNDKLLTKARVLFTDPPKGRDARHTCHSQPRCGTQRQPRLLVHRRLAARRHRQVRRQRAAGELGHPASVFEPAQLQLGAAEHAHPGRKRGLCELQPQPLPKQGHPVAVCGAELGRQPARLAGAPHQLLEPKQQWWQRHPAVRGR